MAKEKSDPQPTKAFDIEEELKKGEKVSIIGLVEALLHKAYISDASDIHLDPQENRMAVRLRIDGILHDSFVFPGEIQQEVVTRIKVLSNLRTDEHQAAQDGRFRIITPKGESVDIRVSIVPAYYGECVVMRLLAEKAETLTLETLGFSAEDLKKVMKTIRRPYGLILCTGPTGSGKTTTLYAIMKILNTREASIITIEDPVEYAIQGINQIQANPRTGLNFANGLRSILRQDPNIIMVGEIRDEETASIAVNAALTGHLMLSTLHTNDAATTLPRLIDMKVEPFLIASTVNIAIGQRLVRTICPDCKEKKKLTEAEIKSLTELVPVKLLEGKLEFYYGKGCTTCNESGYKGRIGVHEVLEINEEIREAIMRRENADRVRAIAIKNGMVTMLEDGFKKALSGITTIEEVLRVVHE